MDSSLGHRVIETKANTGGAITTALLGAGVGDGLPFTFNRWRRLGIKTIEHRLFGVCIHDTFFRFTAKQLAFEPIELVLQ